MDQFTFLVFFIYGLAFFGMGITMALESGRAPALAQARVLRPLAAFGLIHGTHEWLESYLEQAEIIGTPLPGWLSWIRLALLSLSYIALLIFAYQSLSLASWYPIRNPIFNLILFGSYALIIIGSAILAYRISPPPWPDLLDGLMRYLMAVPAAAYSAISLHNQSWQAKQKNHISLGHYLSWTAYGFGIYAVTHLFVRPLDMFPAHFLNADAFLEFFGFPVQIIRTIAAIIISVTLLRASQFMEEERKRQLFSAQQARLEALEQQEDIRRELLRHIVQAQEDERARIARELHDETSQTLTAFTLELATLRELAKRKPQIQDTVAKLQDLSRQMSQGLYIMVHDLRPAHLDDLGLVPAIKSLLDSECCPKGMDVTFEVNGTQKRLDALIEIVLFRVTQEALTNVTRHAGTNQALVRLDYALEAVTLGIVDAGKGFDPNEPLRPPRGWGLEGMRERVESVGGELVLYSAPGRGTTVEVVIPIQEQGE